MILAADFNRIHEQDCQCVVCQEWSGYKPELQIPDEDYPNPFEEVMGG